MKNLLIFLLSALSLTAFAQQKKVAVYVTGDDPMNSIMGDHLVDGIAHDGKYIAVERTASFLNELVKEQSYQQTGAVDDNEISRLGKQFGVDYVCVATPFDVWGEKYISARMIDVERAEVIATSSANGKIENSTQFVAILNTLTKGLVKSFEQSKKADAKKVAVYVTRTGNKDIDIILGDQLVAGFAASGRYLAIERTQGFLNQLSKEQSYQQTGAVDDSDLMRLGKQFGVQYVCIAKTSQLFGDHYIATRLIDVEHGEVINSHKIDAVQLGSSQQVVSVAKEIASKLSDKTITEQLKEDQAKAPYLAQGYVDLGLPSGTLWKLKNEYDYTEKNKKEYANELPTIEQCEELNMYCQWVLQDSGYCVIGPNGNNIYFNFPKYTFNSCTGEFSIVNKTDEHRGSIWVRDTRTNNANDFYLSYYANVNFRGIYQSQPCQTHCIHLVKGVSLPQISLPQKKVAVYVTGDALINTTMGDHLVDGIAHDGKYIAVERTASFLNELVKEQSYQQTGAVDDNEISRLGKQFGVDYVCVATPFDVWGEKYISARMIDVERAEVIATSSANGKIENSTQFVAILNTLTKGLVKSFEQSKKADAKKVAVYVTRTGNKDIDIILGDQLVAGFAASGRYLAIERTQGFLNQLSKEQSYQQTGAVDDSDLMRLGKQFGVQYVCIAKTSQLFGDHYIATRLIDVEHGEVINSHKIDAVQLGSSQQVVSVAKEIATKLSGKTIAEQLKEDQAKAPYLTQGYVDLGLPSGTLWKKSNEGGDAAHFTYDEAVSKFGNNLPTDQQLRELKDKCTWTWIDIGGGYRVTGPNGNSITLPAAGFRGCNGDVSFVGSFGYYWSSTPSDSDDAWALYFNPHEVFIFNDVGRCGGLSVRLVQNL